jgi:hypothetical protein
VPVLLIRSQGGDVRDVNILAVSLEAKPYAPRVDDGLLTDLLAPSDAATLVAGGPCCSDADESQGCSVRTLRTATTRMTSDRRLDAASCLGEVASDDASTRDAPGTSEAEYDPAKVDGDTVVATATSGTANCLAPPSSAPTRTASSCASTAKDAAASSPSPISAAHDRHRHRAVGTAR